MVGRLAHGRSKKIIIAAIVVILIIIAVGIYLFYTSVVNNGNNAALKQLNSQIDVYGANVRYLLNSSTSYNQLFPYSTNYQILLNLSSPFRSIGAVLNSTGTKVQSPGHYNWGAYNPKVRTIVLDNLTMLGVLTPFDANRYGALRNASALKSMYAMSLAAEDILVTAQVVSTIFGGGTFSLYNYSGPESKTISISRCSQSLFTAGGGGSGVLTTINKLCEDNLSSLSLTSIPIGWMELAADINGPLNKIVGNQTVSHGAGSITLYRYLNSMALTQYEGYQLYQILYNTTIPPSMTEIVYTNNVMLVNMGNLNLTNTPAIELGISGTKVGYKRYFNWLIVDINLSVGQYNISAVMPTGVQYEKIYVSPYIRINQYMSTPGANQNGTSMPAKLSVTLNNTAYNSITISMVRGPFFEFGPGITNETINTNGLVLARGNSFTINYTVPDGCFIGEQYLYYFIFNTSYGSASYLPHGTCI